MGVVAPTSSGADGRTVDPSDPRVKKLVYSMYRDMLTNYSDNATEYINQIDPRQVSRDENRIGELLQALASKEGSSDQASSNSTGSMPPPPPPPPMVHHGHIPAVRLNTEIGPRDKGPPMALAGAMMKDKKPFTYTPGGIDLSEIRSPRMAKRLQMNAAAEGVTSAPESRVAQGGVNSAPPHQLSHSAYAAMQPQMAIPVFPQGGFTSNQLSRTPKPSDFASSEKESGGRNLNNGGGAPPPPPPQPHFILQEGGTAPRAPRPPERASVPSPEQEKDWRPNSRGEERVASPAVDRSSPAANVGTGILYVPPISPPPPPPPQLSPTPKPQTKAQAASQHLGSIYIPPIDNLPQQQQQQPRSAGSGSMTPGTAGSAPSPMSLPTPQLNKAPTPWMNSYNRMATKQAESPPYVNPGNTPWGTMSPPPQQNPHGPSIVRTIPISIVREDSDANRMGYSVESPSPTIGGGRPPMGQDQRMTAAQQHLGRVIPIQIQRQENNAQQQQHQQQQQQQHHPQQQQNQRWGTNLPVQVEMGRHPVGGPVPSIRRVVGPVGYNNPSGLYSNQNAADVYQQQAGEAASGFHNMSMGAESPRPEPIQSKSMRLIQKVAENELKRYEEECQWNRGLEDEGHPTSFFTAYSQDPPGGPVTHNIQIRMTPQSPTPQQQEYSGGRGVPASEQERPEPKKYMGSNIPSRSFKILQAMTAADDETSTLDSGASSVSLNNLLPLSQSSTSLTSSEGGFNPLSPSWADPPDPYSYMSWYYWWYYVSYYWAGYDMTGYEYPEGWDPNDPYFPPEFYNNYPTEEDYAYSNDELGDGPSVEVAKGGNIPKIVVGDGDRSLGLKDCDSVRESDEESYWSCAEESDKVIETRDTAQNRATALENHTHSPEDNTPVKSEDKSEDEREDKTEDKFIDNCIDEAEEETDEEEGEERVEGVVEEPDTTTSEDSDATLIDENSSRNLFIEEYISSESDVESHRNLPKNKLSTIEEVTEKSRASSATNAWSDWDGDSKEDEETAESSESSSSEEELSSVSVIENKSDGTRGTESRREEDTSTSDDDTDEDLDQNAVTVRLPIKLSFGKTKSYKDITTLLVMDEETKADEPLFQMEPPPQSIKKEVTFQVQEVREEDEEMNEEEEEEEEPIVSFTISLSRQPSREEEVSVVVEDEPDIDFWGQIMPDSKEMQSEVADVKSVDEVWVDSDTKNNFWDKSVKTIERKRFGNFEISEDYESDSGMRSDTGPSTERQKVKRYTHTQKRHSVPGLPQWKRSNSIINSAEKPSQLSPKSEKNTEKGDLSTGWSFWDEMESQNRSPDLKIISPEPETPSEEIKNCDEESSDEDENEVEVNVQVSLPLLAAIQLNSNSELSQHSADFSEYEEEESEKEEEVDEEEWTNVESSNQEIEVDEFGDKVKDLPPPASDETSDESSSKSSGATTIATSEHSAAKGLFEVAEVISQVVEVNGLVEEVKSEVTSEVAEEEPEVMTSEEVKDSGQISEERSIKIHELGERIKLLGNENDEKCTCHLGNRMAKAESLLWRIERFLHESLSLGSEDDSGVMTDLSRQISDVDTDADNDQNDTEFLLSAAAAAKERRSHHGNCTANAPKSPEVVRRRPQSEIIFESSSLEVEENTVKMRTTSAEKKALRYQRAKTHSRLFQLLQDECGKDEDDEDDEEEEADFCGISRETITTVETSTVTQVSPGATRMGPINVDTSDMTERRSRLLPLPLKNILGSSFDSNSSPSGSSGVLSPTSPVTRDQLLADIISEFSLRHSDSSSSILQNRKRFSRFPSKIFKLLQEEFGEEFYQTFEVEDRTCGPDLLIPGMRSVIPGMKRGPATTATPTATTTPTATSLLECRIHKSDSLKEMEESSKQSSPDFLQVPLRKKTKHFTRDLRSPKNKTT